MPHSHLATKGYKIPFTIVHGVDCDTWDRRLAQPPNQLMIENGKVSLSFEKTGLVVVSSIVLITVAVVLTMCWIVMSWAPWPFKADVNNQFDKVNGAIESNRKDAAATQVQQNMINAQMLEQLKGLTTTVETNRKEAANREDLEQDATGNNSDSITQLQQMMMDKGMMLPSQLPKRRQR